MLVHIPIYCVPGRSESTARFMLELILGCLESYYANGNDHHVLVTTNDKFVKDLLDRYRSCSRWRFELLLVTPKDLTVAFRTSTEKLDDEPCLRMIFSKFYPILRQVDHRIVHLDYDTLFLSKIDFRPMFVLDVNLVDSNHLSRRCCWYPDPTTMRFFRMNPAKIRSVSSWINSGVFSIQGRGFDLCREELNWFFTNLEWAISASINIHADEIIMNALAVREPGSVALIRDHRYNSLAYLLDRDPNWLKRGGIVHFHGNKPNAVSYETAGVARRFRPSGQGRISDDYYLAALLWCRHLHNACTPLGYDCHVLHALPIDVVGREIERLLPRSAERTVRQASARGKSRLG